MVCGARTNNGALNTFKVDGKNQLTNASPVGVQTYDANGNLLGNGGASDRLYTYDDENQLIGIEREEVWRTELVYDGKGRLRVRKEYDWSDAWVLNTETRYLYDGMRVIQERSNSNVPQVSYTRGTDLSGSLEGLPRERNQQDYRSMSVTGDSKAFANQRPILSRGEGGIGGLLARSHGYSAGNWSTHNYYHPDGNGNITYMVNSSQGLAAKYRYDPYGNAISSSGTLASANVYRFSSKEFHSNSGLYYYGYRWYHPNLQRWLNRDPIGEIAGANLFRFIANNSISRHDPLGLTDCSDPCGDAKKQGKDKGNPAGTVCCDGKKYACVWDQNGDTNPTDPKAKQVIKSCLEAHENEHVNDPNVTCKPNCLDMAHSSKSSECKAYKAELSCLRSGMQACAGNPQCITDVLNAQRTTKIGIKDKCGK